ncbi:sugar phosphate isomerase [Halolactibacillus miurensis]|uniref:Sugar phosphate isomerase n=1 Tax=Halolactibacillus miurensis TaxID=306541 RepID=A0A1I6P1I8_9BACI|nr:MULTISPECIES: sugar phosphate isomerase/epimerase family protein [Halolactibacillus]GEM03186.1 sugar phosphate isomerase [Halolactibacillus miurensis]SFS34023.1 Sugar phosphate isomerase/epimerase [Halolactibacillus miurensis]
MKYGLSSYSLLDAINNDEMDILDVVTWVSEQGFDHLELVPYGYTLVDNYALADKLVDRAKSLGLELSNYALPANFIHETEADFLEEVERLKSHVDLLNHMGIKHMRHDVTLFTLPPECRTISYLEKHLDQIVRGSQLLADYAAQFGITTTIENHGMAVQHSDRVLRVVEKVNRDNFNVTLDVGNFLCVDEDPLVGIKKLLPHASLIHFKDFYRKPYYAPPLNGKWFDTASGNYIRGAILGQGDLHLVETAKLIKASGYDGYLTLEFEGMEECRMASQLGLEYLKHLFEE